MRMHVVHEFEFEVASAFWRAKFQSQTVKMAVGQQLGGWQSESCGGDVDI
jgi:hypothetical protein